MNGAAKIANIKREITGLTKNSKNPFFKSSYLDLPDLLAALDQPLEDNKVVLLQPCKRDSVASQLIDEETGDLLAESELVLPEIQDPQKIGSAVTYYRRYTLLSLLGLAAEDDDGNTATKAAIKDLDKYKKKTN